MGMLFFRARYILLGALAVGAVGAAYLMDPLTRAHAVAAALAWLAVCWWVVLPWGLCGVLLLLWRRQLRLAARWREASQYWLGEYDRAIRMPAARQQQPRPRSKVGAGRRV